MADIEKPLGKKCLFSTAYNRLGFTGDHLFLKLIWCQWIVALLFHFQLAFDGRSILKVGVIVDRINTRKEKWIEERPYS